MERVKCDVLVVGAGGAGLRAAISAAEAGAQVALVSKSLLGKAHTVMAEGGIAAALGNMDERDNWKVHFRDTIRGGKGLCNWEMAKLHAEQSPGRVRELERWGAVFDRTPDGRINQRNFGGHRYPRLAHVGDRTGLEIIRTLQDHVIHIDGVDVQMETTVTRLLKSGERVTGALAYRRTDGELLLFAAGAVIIATGGIGKAYRVTSNSWEYTGDGHALAYLVGADLVDMEFVQFHPTGMVWPPSVKGTLVTEGVRGEGGILLNSEGERFMFNYIPEAFAAETAKDEAEAEAWLRGEEGAMRPPELLTRDVVARAIMDEVKAGRGSPQGGAFLDIANRRITVEPGTAERLPVAGGSIDALLTVNAVHHWVDLDLAFAELARVLAPGGRLVLMDEDFTHPEHPMHETHHGHEDEMTNVDVDAIAASLSGLGLEATGEKTVAAGVPVKLIRATRPA